MLTEGQQLIEMKTNLTTAEMFAEKLPAGITLQYSATPTPDDPNMIAFFIIDTRDQSAINVSYTEHDLASADNLQFLTSSSKHYDLMWNITLPRR